MTHHSKGLIAENIMHYILKLECLKVMTIIAIIGLLYDTLVSEPFYTHFWCIGVCCVVARSILKPTDGITKENRKEMYEILISNQRLHILGSVQ